MRILTWIYDIIRNDKIRSERFWEDLGVASIGDKIRKIYRDGLDISNAGRKRRLWGKV